MVRRSLVVLGALAALGVWALAPAVASAGEGCANEALREAQGSTYLPDCRGYELVSASENNEAINNGVQFAPDGSRVLFQQLAADSIWEVATRQAFAGGTGRWLQTSMVPPVGELLPGAYGVIAASPDRSSLVFSVQLGLLTNGNPPPVTLAQVDVSGRQRVLAPLESGEVAGTSYALTSSDGAHVFSDLPHAFDAGHVAGTNNVYDVGVSPPLLVSRLPDNSVPACGVPVFKGFANFLLSSSERQGWVSADGSKVFFLTRGSGDCSNDPVELYQRDIATGTTTLISTPPVSGPPADVQFLRASADGSTALFVTGASLTAQDTNTDQDVYRWTATGGVECLTCVVPDAAIEDVSNDDLSGSIGVSQDLSHVYFISQNQLASGASVGVPNLYVWSGGAIRYVAPGATIGDLADSPGHGAEITPDGNVLAFASSSPELDALTGSTNGGFKQYYRYDDRDGSLTCMSCPAGKAPTGPVPPFMSPDGDAGQVGYVSVLSRDGSRFVFRSVDALVSRDVNGGSDLYEWHDGRVSLITDGVSPGGTANRPTAILRGMSEEGTDVFFTDFSKLTPDATDGSMQLYDARENGGEPPAPAAGGCSNESCQGSPASAPVFGAPSSVSVEGAGNAPPPPRKQSRTVTRAQKLKQALKACRRKHGGARRGCEARARRAFGRGSMVRRGK
jgi:hypothetical protein